MKVRIIKTGEILDVNTDRANYWIRCKVAEEVKEEVKEAPKDVEEEHKTEKVDDAPIEKKAVVKKPITKKAKKK